MKQYKMKTPTPTRQQTATETTSKTRQEIDVKLKELARVVEKNPRKAAQVFASWLDKSPKTQQKKRAA